MGNIKETQEFMEKLQEKLIDVRKVLKEAEDQLYFRTMLAAHKLLIDKYLPFKVGDRVVITNEHEDWAKKCHNIRPGAFATIREIDILDEDTMKHSGGEAIVCYFLEFDEETWIYEDPITKKQEVRPRSHKHLYSFKGEGYFQRI